MHGIDARLRRLEAAVPSSGPAYLVVLDGEWRAWPGGEVVHVDAERGTPTKGYIGVSPDDWRRDAPTETPAELAGMGIPILKVIYSSEVKHDSE